MASLAQMPPAERAAIVTRLVPALEAEIKKPPPVAQGGQVAADPTVPYKDAAFALLTHEGGTSRPRRAAPQAPARRALGWISVEFRAALRRLVADVFASSRWCGDLRADAVQTPAEPDAAGRGQSRRMAELVADFGDPADQARGERTARHDRHRNRLGSLDSPEEPRRRGSQQGRQAHSDPGAVQGSSSSSTRKKSSSASSPR